MFPRFGPPHPSPGFAQSRGRRWGLLVYQGQSGSTGYGDAAATTTAPAGTDNRKLSTGGLQMLDYSAPNATLRNASALVTLAEANETVQGLSMGETGIAACANELSRRFPSERFIGASAGVVSQPLSNRVQGTSIYAGMLAAVTAIKALLPPGDTLRVLARIERGGEADMYSGIGVEVALLADQAAGEIDLKAITGQTEPIPIICSQPVSPTGGGTDVCQALVNLAQDYPTRIILAGPTYQFGSVDAYHLTADGHRRRGVMEARAIAAAIWGPGTFRGVLPISVVRVGANVDITFAVEVAPLVFDTSGISEPAGTVKGFEWYDSTASATVSTVTITSATTVRVTLSGTPTGSGKAIRYAHTSDVDRAADTAPIGTGRRGNLRDSSTLTDALGNAVPNWCGCFNESAA